MKATAASVGSTHRKAPGAGSAEPTASAPSAATVPPVSVAPGSTPASVAAQKPAARKPAAAGKTGGLPSAASPSVVPRVTAARPAACAAADGLTVDKVQGKPLADASAEASEPAPPPARPAAAAKSAASKPAADAKAPDSKAPEAKTPEPKPAAAGPAASADPAAEATEAPVPRAPGFAATPQAPAPAPPDAAGSTAPPTTSAPPAQAGGPMRPMQQSGRPMPPPRPLAKAENFVQGDHVVYPTHGVGKVERIAVEEIAGHKLELIHITFEENRMTLRVPVAKARTAGLRKLATRSLFDEALAVLRGKARIKRTMWSRRAQEYEAKINSGDPLAIAEVVRDLHRNAGQPDQSFSERQIYEAAMDRLAAELAALDQTDKPTAAIKLAEFLKTV